MKAMVRAVGLSFKIVYTGSENGTVTVALGSIKTRHSKQCLRYADRPIVLLCIMLVRACMSVDRHIPLATKSLCVASTD